jgi:hypothetical protein
MITNVIQFPEPIGLNCKMMLFIQGDINSVPKEYHSYEKIIND